MDIKPEEGIKMSTQELKKEVAETTNQNAPTDETNEPSKEDSKQETPVEKQEESKVEEQPGIDYEAELAKIKEERENYKQGMLNAKAKLKEKEDEPGEEESIPPSINVDEITQQVTEQVRQQIDSHLVADRQDFLQDTLNSLSDNVKERELIQYHYENTINKSGYSKSAIANDMANAKILANKSKLISENEELRQALIAKNSLSNAGVGSTYRTVEEKSEVPLTEDDKAFLKKRGLDPSKVKNEVKI